MEFLQVARKSRLRYPQSLRRKPAAQILLVRDALISNQSKNLALAKCFSYSHNHSRLSRYAYLYMALHTSVNAISSFFERIPRLTLGLLETRSCPIQRKPEMRTGFSGRGMLLIVLRPGSH